MWPTVEFWGKWFWTAFLTIPEFLGNNWVGALFTCACAFLYERRKLLISSQFRNAKTRREKLHALGDVLMGHWRATFKLWAVVLVAFFVGHAFDLVRKNADSLESRWQDEHKKAQGQSVYIETHIEADLFPQKRGGGEPQLLALDHPVTAKFVWVRTGTDIANNVRGHAKIYIESDDTIQTQRRITADFENKFDEVLAKLAARGSEGRVWGYSPDSTMGYITPIDPPPILTKPLLDDLWAGSKFVFYVSAVAYQSPSGQEYESHFCNYLQPLGINDPSHTTIPNIPDYEIPISIKSCETFNNTIRK